MDNGAGGADKHLSTDFTNTALLLQTVRVDVSFSDWSSCRAIQIWAKLAGGVMASLVEVELPGGCP